MSPRAVFFGAFAGAFYPWCSIIAFDELHTFLAADKQMVYRSLIMLFFCGVGAMYLFVVLESALFKKDSPVTIWHIPLFLGTIFVFAPIATFFLCLAYVVTLDPELLVRLSTVTFLAFLGSGMMTWLWEQMNEAANDGVPGKYK